MSVLNTLQYKFMFKLLDISEIEGSIQTILLTNKKELAQFTDQMKKAKRSAGKLELNFP